MEQVVYILDKGGHPLMPTKRFGKVRRMMKEGQAVPVCYHPFTIRLTYETPHYLQKEALEQDPEIDFLRELEQDVTAEQKAGETPS